MYALYVHCTRFFGLLWKTINPHASLNPRQGFATFPIDNMYVTGLQLLDCWRYWRVQRAATGEYWEGLIDIRIDEI